LAVLPDFVARRRGKIAQPGERNGTPVKLKSNLRLQGFDNLTSLFDRNISPLDEAGVA
jgi:hypothetical protein